MRHFIPALVLLFSASALAGGTVTHKSPCPGYYRSLDACMDYDFPAEVAIGESEVPFGLEFYTPESASTGEREYLEIEGELSATLIFMYSESKQFEFPVKLLRVAPGKYEVRGATFIKPGMWSLRVDIARPGELIKRSNLFVYIYPDR
ncbi:MAG: hypothetical protein NDJ89_13735 [Oligoflexia bacterium]|nr:hypothetical protein [Oligoflexia bacterium]